MPQITLLGSMSVGKTTLLKLLQNHDLMSGFEFIPESASQIIERYQQHPITMDNQQLSHFQQRVLDNQIINENIARQNNSNFVSDRGVIDGLSYSIELSCYQDLKQQVINHLKINPYSHIFYLPIEFGFNSTNRSTENRQFQRLIDTRLKDIMSELKLEYTVLNGSSVKRMEQILSALKNSPFGGILN